jgi:hypothetical protein
MDGYFLTSVDSNELTRQTSRDVFIKSLSRTISIYKSIGAQVVVVLQVPQQKVDAHKTYAKLFGLKKADSITTRLALESLSVDFSAHLELQRFNRMVFSEYEKSGAIQVLNPDPFFCNRQRCPIGTESVPFFKDHDHVSSAGALLLEGEILRLISP